MANRAALAGHLPHGDGADRASWHEIDRDVGDVRRPVCRGGDPHAVRRTSHSASAWLGSIRARARRLRPGGPSGRGGSIAAFAKCSAKRNATGTPRQRRPCRRRRPLRSSTATVAQRRSGCLQSPAAYGSVRVGDRRVARSPSCRLWDRPSSGTEPDARRHASRDLRVGTGHPLAGARPARCRARRAERRARTFVSTARRLGALRRPRDLDGGPAISSPSELPARHRREHAGAREPRPPSTRSRPASCRVAHGEAPRSRRAPAGRRAQSARSSPTTWPVSTSARS